MSIEVKCSKCDTRLLREPNQIRTRKQHFCNRECFNQYRIEHKEVEVECSGCSTKLIRSSSSVKINKTGMFFCSFDCKSRFNRRGYSVVCVVCGKDFEKVPAEQKRHPVHCCSVECRSKYNDRRVAKDCEECGKQFFRPPSVLKDRKNLFCSIKCHDEFQDLREDVVCDQCGVGFKKQKSIIKRSNKNFCSKGCFAKFSFDKNFIECEFQRLAEELDIDFCIHDRKTLRNPEETDGRKGLELDFYFPQVKYAVEINGQSHYKPLYGEERLAAQKVRDSKKKRQCKELGIKLRVVKPGNCRAEQYLPRFKKVISEIKKRAAERGII